MFTKYNGTAIDIYIYITTKPMSIAQTWMILYAELYRYMMKMIDEKKSSLYVRIFNNNK